MTNAADVVIWSADVGRQRLFEKLVPDLPIKYVKLDRGGLTAMNLRVIAEVQDLGYKVFADAKIYEIPDKATDGTDEMPGLAAQHLVYRPWMLNCSVNIRSTLFWEHENLKKVDGLKRFADMCHAVGTRPCGVTVLTSTSEGTVNRAYNGRTAIEQVLVDVEMLHSAGFTDIVCSPLELEAIRAESLFDRMDINTPGIRLPGSDPEDQDRVDTPFAALQAGATRLVIGRDLTNGDLEANFQKIANNIDQKD